MQKKIASAGRACVGMIDKIIASFLPLHADIGGVFLFSVTSSMHASRCSDCVSCIYPSFIFILLHACMAPPLHMHVSAIKDNIDITLACSEGNVSPSNSN